MLYYIATSIIIGSLTYAATHSDVIVTKYKLYKKKWGRLTTLVSGTEKSMCMIYIVSLKMIIQMLYLSLIQYLNSNIKLIDVNKYEVSYVLNSKIYKLIVVPIRGPQPILQIIDDSGNDITDKVLPYMGPRYDWHGSHIDPSFFDTTFMSFELSDGTSETLFSAKLKQEANQSRERIDDPQ
jgi:hypothetical protein